MNTSQDTAEADRALKSKHRAMWALGDYSAVASEVVQELGPVLVEACAVGPGQRVLDVAAGSGNAAIPAAQAGAEVFASDLTPELLEAGEALAATKGVRLRWQPGDAESLPYNDNNFDVVLSCVGVMFAPHHQRGADEMVRVCQPGGTIGLLSWTPEGFIGQMFSTMKPYTPAPPPDAQPPPLWGNQDHVMSLFGDRITDVSAQRRKIRIDLFDTGVAFRDYFKANYGPTIAAYSNIVADPDKVAALDRDLADLADQSLSEGAMEWEYLLFTAHKTKI